MTTANLHSDKDAVQALVRFITDFCPRAGIRLRPIPSTNVKSEDWGMTVGAPDFSKGLHQTEGTADILWYGHEGSDAYGNATRKAECLRELRNLWELMEDAGYDMAFFSLEPDGHKGRPCIHVYRSGIRQVREYLGSAAEVDNLPPTGTEGKSWLFSPIAMSRVYPSVVVPTGPVLELQQIRNKLELLKARITVLLGDDARYAKKAEGRTLGWRHHRLLEGMRQIQDLLDEGEE